MEAAYKCRGNNKVRETVKKPVFITQDPVMKNLYQKVKLVARSQAPVFITGESGTGKEVLARLLHYHSPRKEKPFVALNCGALPEDIVESEMFGHEKGSFTGAVRKKEGCFEQADDGFLFLDEIGEMSPRTQVKLLRAVELKNFRRVGGSEEIQTDVQIVSATNRDITEMMEKESFREDLFYRLSVIELTIPPLRERRGDIPLLGEFFLSKCIENHNLPAKRLSEDFKERLVSYDWPGNVRELNNVIERCAIMCTNEEIVHTEHLPRAIECSKTESLQMDRKHTTNGNHSNFQIPVGTSMKNAERIIIRQTLSYTDNNISEAARILEVSRNTLHNKLSKYVSEGISS